MILPSFFSEAYARYKSQVTWLHIDVDNHGTAFEFDVSGEDYDDSVQTYSALHYLDSQSHIQH